MCQGLSDFQIFLHHLVSAKLATSSIRVNGLKTASNEAYIELAVVVKEEKRI